MLLVLTSEMAAGLQCISPWLSNMVNPETIADSLTSLQAELAVFSPARAAAASGLATYNTVRPPLPPLPPHLPAGRPHFASAQSSLFNNLALFLCTSW